METSSPKSCKSFWSICGSLCPGMDSPTVCFPPVNPSFFFFFLFPMKGPVHWFHFDLYSLIPSTHIWRITAPWKYRSLILFYLLLVTECMWLTQIPGKHTELLKQRNKSFTRNMADIELLNVFIIYLFKYFRLF